MTLKRVIEDCKKNRVPVGQVRGGAITDLINQKQPHAVTIWGNEVAYVIPEEVIRELIKNEH